MITTPDQSSNTFKSAPSKADLIVKMERCPQNHPCPSVRVCPVDALSQEGFAAPKVDMEKCIRCGKCVDYCPMNALVLK
jgi:Formate hydrogenlyase subunit 6/NADH:ubiquinone oxidoreductase 23 kD subunit (chain I)